MTKLAIVFDGPPSHESGRFVEVELDGRGISFGEWQQNGEFWELVIPADLAAAGEEIAGLREALGKCHQTHGKQYGTDWQQWKLANERNNKLVIEIAELKKALERISEFYVDKDGHIGGGAVDVAQEALFSKEPT